MNATKNETNTESTDIAALPWVVRAEPCHVCCDGRDDSVICDVCAEIGVEAEMIVQCPMCHEYVLIAALDEHVVGHADEATDFERVIGIRKHAMCGDDRLRFATINGVGTEYAVIEAVNGDGDCDVMCMAAPNCSVMPMLRNVPFVTALQYATFLVATEMMQNDQPSTRTGTGSAYDAIAQATAATLA